MRIPTLLGLIVLTASCANPDGEMRVKQFHLRNLSPADEDPMVRMEKERRLHGAVSMNERRERLGHYYTILWQDPPDAAGSADEVVFEYRQSATGSVIRRQVRRIEAGAEATRIEFAIIGREYLEGGRVLAWKATVKRSGRVLATRQSYLWD